MLLYTSAADSVEARKRTLLSTNVLSIKAWQVPGLISILLLYLAVATVYLTVVPPLEGFDAPAHMNGVNYWRQEQSPPTIDLATNQYSYELLTQPPLYYMIAALATAWLPAANADGYVRESNNHYFPGLSTRQSIDLPSLPSSVAHAMLVARLISLLGGVVTVVATWLWIRAAVVGQPWLPTAVAAVVAFNPLFLFISTAITNDAWAAAGTTTVVWLMTRTAIHRNRSLWRWLLVGAVAGMAALTKYSVLLVTVPALVILLQYRHHRPIGHFLRVALALFGGAALTAGWWYGRNFLLYGEPIPVTAMRTVITSLQRAELLTPTEVWALLPFLFYSYWGLFVATFAPSQFFTVVRWAVMVALIGLPLGLLWRSQQKMYTKALWLAFIWFTLNLISMVNYMRLVSYGEQARFLLTAAPAIALLLVCGWQGWVPQRFAAVLRVAIVPAMIGLALWPLPTLRSAYVQPSQMQAVTPMRPVGGYFDGGMQVVGYDLPTGAAFPPTQTLPVTLYFTTEQPIDDSYTFFLHLVDSEDRLLYQYDGVLFRGRHPTRQWQPGVIFADTYELTLLQPVEQMTLATLTLGFYRYEAPRERLAVYDTEGTAIGDRLVLGQIRLLDAPPQTTAPAIAAPLARWTAGIELLTAQIDPSADGYAIQLQWRTTQLLNTNYTVFLQFLDADGAIVAQIDRQPHAGAAPTSTWLIDEVIPDAYHLTPPPTWQQLIVGLYTAADGQRLLLQDPTPNADSLLLQRR